ncbi:tRNA lysidine(34) synthetase TilS [Flavobacterium branchiophilum NBRC 15030 = ATCC 35035]|uniref:tRNA(Ile)-lysidine synthase n=1 Tax=Flavobacterium branchiophilum TaxID=55197 RepID=A0A543G797_9FLAO|nr:tRNA lysidine(34) synthetase TilS [Flavobacterium branchiophilum]OXA74744.1 tRNA lysidine(34) synthetase TilS [Flavobacterium branchiophilum NBRC 15030 = ATCC 35035]TQM41947.1 tRNA(Ile)-lysidine synthase [Flavobacterium branchiophilum]GEM55044.1 tRNA(Ile)-lysidine synthase [Flavobacterium branchiophilum NBRC 15030 = ATCC 35035]
MEYKFKQIIKNKLPFLEGKKILLAVSGGLDSMVLTDLFIKTKFSIAIAHCNFNLRDTESQGDQEFVATFCTNKHIPLFVKSFETLQFANDNKLSTQVAARNLRYEWFQNILKQHEIDFIATAHHADDNLETFIINLSRGTGIDGLKGIPFYNNNIVRPLLYFSKENIRNYALKNNIQWREDSSNASDKYLRNKIRHQIVPILKELNPSFLNNFQKAQLFLDDTQTLAKDAATLLFKKLTLMQNGVIYFDLVAIKKLPNFKAYLYYWLKDYGFKAWTDIFDLIDSQTGKQVFSKEFQLLKNREQLILKPISETINSFFWIDKNQTKVNFPLNLDISKVDCISNSKNNTIFVDADQLKFPLCIRKWQLGDVFFSKGMKGKSKKISKYFKDEKFSALDKESTWLLCSDDQIVWVIDKRQDERFAANNNTINILQIKSNL